LTPPAGVDPRLIGRVALITGGGSGLGRATALRLAEHGAYPVVADVAADAAKGTVELIRERGQDGRAIHLDVTDPATVRDCVAQLCAEFDEAFNCLINNAGTDEGASLLNITDEQWRRVIAVNQTGPLYMSREFLRHAVRRDPALPPADIVNIISISAITVGTEAAAYNSSKAALAKLTEVMQREAHEFHWPVRIHGIMPSAMNTPMMDQWHLDPAVMMDPDSVASAIVFVLALPPDTFVQNLIVNSRREPSWPR
jgi:NAD(P)-dependent dehydrogenase (short-subunit alcohol dehydrogenase family)